MGSPNLDKTDSEDDKDDNENEDDDEDDNGENEDDGLAVNRQQQLYPLSHLLLLRHPYPVGQKRKSIADSIADISAHEEENRIKIAKINAMAKTHRSTERERIKRRTHMEMELARLQHQRDEAAAQRAHEAAHAQRAHEALMFDKQIALGRASSWHT